MTIQELEKGSKIKCECSDGSKYIIFDHPDGMYSYSKTEKGAIIHLSRFTEIEKEKDYYKLIN